MLKILSWEDVRVALERMLKEEGTVYTKAPGPICGKESSRGVWRVVMGVGGGGGRE